MNIETLYLKSPVFLQKLFLNLQGYRIVTQRFNKTFREKLEHFDKSSNNEIDTAAIYSFFKIADKIPFWHNRFKKYGLEIREDFDPIRELKKLPILTKNEVKENQELINNLTLSNKISWNHTSGTTGSGLVFPQTLEMEKKQWTVWWRYRTWHGIELNTWMGWFGGRSIANVKQKNPPFWRINYPMKQVMFSSHHLNENTVEFYFNQLKERKLHWLHGYPSQIALLAYLIKNNNLGRLPELKIITLGAENFLQSQKEIIEEVFKVPARQHYGLAEGVANISEHPDGELKPDQDFCYTEFVPVDKNNPSVCRIVGTNYNNPAFPLFRYDTGDIAHIDWQEDGSPKVLSIDGRQEDYITLPNGVKLGRLDHIFKDLTDIQEAQIYQPNLNNVVLRIVKGKNFDKNKQEKQVLTETKKRLGDKINITIAYQDKIKRTNSGKLRFVISEVN